VVRLIEDRVGSDPATIVVAPSGYGKTSAVSEWADTHPGRVAWLTIGPFDIDPARLGISVLRALQTLADAGQCPDLAALLEFDASEVEPAAAYDLLSEVLIEAEAPVYLVVDDAHRAQEQLARGLLGALIEIGCEPLRLVVVGTSYVEIALSRLVLSRPQLVIRAHDLAFDLAEIASLQAGAGPTPEAILEETRGWPIAIRFVHMTGVRPAPASHPDESLIRDYVNDHLLSAVPQELAEFALLTSVCEEMSVELAAAVSGRDDAAELLERCVRLGLFIDRYDTPRGAVYRWHGIFARYCREILHLTRPGARERAYAAAAGFAAPDDPLLAASYWLRAGEPETAVETVVARWVGLVVGADSSALDHWCAALPRPYDDDPRVLLIRACAQDIGGARAIAQLLAARAEARAASGPVPPGYETVRSQAVLLLLDAREELTDASERLKLQLESADAIPVHTRAAMMYLLGFAGLRHRHAPGLTIQYLSSAATEAEAAGDTSLANRALSNLAFTLAWAGQMRRAQAVLDRHIEAVDDDSWTAYAGGGAAAAAGFIGYWADDLEQATVDLMRSIRGGSSAFAFAGIARMQLAFTAAATRDPQTCHRAARELQAIPREARQGLSWPAFRHASLAALHEAAGRRDRALKIVDRYEDADDLPLVSVILAGIAARSGRVPQAYSEISYVAVAALSIGALNEWQHGRPGRAQDLLEQALEIAVPENLRRSFSGGGIEMRKLLTEHLAWGTAHESFITRCLAPHHTSGPLDRLSDRERAVFAQLRTTKTMQEIAETLGVSINTVKTHQRSIYRKLSVSTRREAVRRFA
jgi:LuxR family maltose regulon positive regulatory protein